VPVASYQLAHHEVVPGAALYAQPAAWMVLGALCFSALTVYGWAKMAFGSGVKALGFVVLLEGVLVASQTPWLALGALGYLVAVNGVATGCRLAN